MTLISAKWRSYGLLDESELLQDFLNLEERNRKLGETNKSLDLRLGMLKKEIGVHQRAAINRRGEIRDLKYRLHTADRVLKMVVPDEEEPFREYLDRTEEHRADLDKELRAQLEKLSPGELPNFEHRDDISDTTKIAHLAGLVRNLDAWVRNLDAHIAVNEGIQLAHTSTHNAQTFRIIDEQFNSYDGRLDELELSKEQYDEHTHESDFEFLRSKVEELHGRLDLVCSGHEHPDLHSKIEDAISKATAAVSDFEELRTRIIEVDESKVLHIEHEALKKRYELHTHMTASRGGVDR